ncbi:PD-(D/E)XK nuclease-like domain-containing protein [Pseudooceanicola nitratireducens]|uniref:PD-(D/E)XK nuclease-like domain-containing protein n=1 Tax=Pseudooceanicola nitratireducens TaxID=517719 RepID=UPI003C7B8D99
MTEIRTLQPDEHITEPGFYRMPLDRHHSQPCMSKEDWNALSCGVLPPITSVSVTSGVLRKIELSTPADVWAFHLLNQNRWERPETAALRMGRAIAAHLEGGMEEVGKFFHVLERDRPNRPTDKQMEDYANKGASNLSDFCLIGEDAPRKPTAKQIAAYDEGAATEAAKASVEFWRKVEADGRTPVTRREADQIIALKKRVEYWRKVEADPRTPLTDAEIKLIEDMAKAFHADPVAAAMMGGIPEVTMAWQDEQTGLWCLSRPDTVSFDGVVSDYKKMATRGSPFNHRLVDSRITQHGYDMQMGFAVEGMERLVQQTPDAVIVAQWDQPPYHVIPREIEAEDIGFGKFRNRRALTLFSECYGTGNWFGPGEDMASYQRPDWQREMLIDQMAIANASL